MPGSDEMSEPPNFRKAAVFPRSLHFADERLETVSVEFVDYLDE